MRSDNMLAPVAETESLSEEAEFAISNWLAETALFALTVGVVGGYMKIKKRGYGRFATFTDALRQSISATRTAESHS